MNDEQIQQVVAQVLKRLLPQIGATGTRGDVIVVFTGATAGFTEAMQQVRSLILSGYRVKLAFSRGAELLYGPLINEQLEGFPNVAPIEQSKWLRALKEAQAVVVPLLSVNTLSKLALLIADNLASNVILHALFTGKPVLLAQNGVDTSDQGRIELHFDKCGPLLAAAIEERLQIVRSYGCRLTDVSRLVAELEVALQKKPLAKPISRNGKPRNPANARVITAGDVLQAYQSGASIRLLTSTVVTPLAREVAFKHGVSLETEV